MTINPPWIARTHFIGHSGTAQGRRRPRRSDFTDPESRILKTKDGFIQGYNAQAVVDGKAQIIVAHDLVAQMSDQHQLVPLLDGIKANLGGQPKEASADAGYCSEANL